METVGIGVGVGVLVGGITVGSGVRVGGSVRVGSSGARDTASFVGNGDDTLVDDSHADKMSNKANARSKIHDATLLLAPCPLFTSMMFIEDQ
jgi:hypothetical protein